MSLLSVYTKLSTLQLNERLASRTISKPDVKTETVINSLGPSK